MRPLAAIMTIPKIIKVARYFTLFTFLLSTILILLIYFSPTHSIVNVSILYAALFSLSSLIIFLVLGFKIVSRKSGRRIYTAASLLLLLNIFIAFVYFKIWSYAIDSILIKIVNNTGKNVTEAGIYGCFEETWGTLSNGESKTVRFPGNVGCAFMVTYKINDSIKLEMLPRKEFTRNIYYLGENPSLGMVD